MVKSILNMAFPWQQSKAINDNQTFLLVVNSFMSLNMRIGRKWISQNQFLSGFAFCSSLEFFLEVNINNNSSFSGGAGQGLIPLFTSTISKNHLLAVLNQLVVELTPESYRVKTSVYCICTFLVLLSLMRPWDRINLFLGVNKPC